MPRALLSLALLALAAAPPASARTAFAPPFPGGTCGFACPCGCRPGDICPCGPAGMPCPFEPFGMPLPWEHPEWEVGRWTRAARGGCCPPVPFVPPVPELP